MRNPADRLHDILDAITAIERHSGGDKLALEEDELLQTWFLRHLQIIGEAARAIPEDVRAVAPEVPWHQIAGMRNVLVHGYFNHRYRPRLGRRDARCSRNETRNRTAAHHPVVTVITADLRRTRPYSPHRLAEAQEVFAQNSPPRPRNTPEQAPAQQKTGSLPENYVFPFSPVFQTLAPNPHES